MHRTPDDGNFYCAYQDTGIHLCSQAAARAKSASDEAVRRCTCLDTGREGRLRGTKGLSQPNKATNSDCQKHPRLAVPLFRMYNRHIIDDDLLVLVFMHGLLRRMKTLLCSSFVLRIALTCAVYPFPKTSRPRPLLRRPHFDHCHYSFGFQHGNLLQSDLSSAI